MFFCGKRSAKAASPGGTYRRAHGHIHVPKLRGSSPRDRGGAPRTGSGFVKNDIEERVRELAAYLLERQCTVRAAAARFGVSKSTVHKDMSERLEQIDRALWLRVRGVLERNKAERHIRGGLATRR